MSLLWCTTFLLVSCWTLDYIFLFTIYAVYIAVYMYVLSVSKLLLPNQINHYYYYCNNIWLQCLYLIMRVLMSPYFLRNFIVMALKNCIWCCMWIHRPIHCPGSSGCAFIFHLFQTCASCWDRPETCHILYNAIPTCLSWTSPLPCSVIVILQHLLQALPSLHSACPDLSRPFQSTFLTTVTGFSAKTLQFCTFPVFQRKHTSPSHRVRFSSDFTSSSNFHWLELTAVVTFSVFPLALFYLLHCWKNS